jgi:hypothetical protein
LCLSRSLELRPRARRLRTSRAKGEVAKLRSDLPDTLKLKEAELSAEQRRLANFVDFIGEGRGSQALAKALVETERRVDTLSEEAGALRRSRDKIFRPPPVEWIKDRLNNIQQLLERRIARSAQTLRQPAPPDPPRARHAGIGRLFYRAVTTLDTLALIEEPPPAGAESGSNSLQRWTRTQEFEPPRAYPWRRSSSTARTYRCT